MTHNKLPTANGKRNSQCGRVINAIMANIIAGQPKNQASKHIQARRENTADSWPLCTTACVAGSVSMLGSALYRSR
jgi:hypothetical protein